MQLIKLMSENDFMFSLWLKEVVVVVAEVEDLAVAVVVEVRACDVY